MSIFTGNPYSFLINQINLRQDKMSDRSPETLSWQNTNTANIRLTSSVNIDEPKLAKYLGVGLGNELAKTHVMENGELYFDKAKNTFRQRYSIGDKGGAYGDKNNGTRTSLHGILPMSGITSVSIQSLGAIGSLQTATINLRVNSLTELERIELLYCRVGYTLLLEITNSIFFQNNGKYTTSYPKYNILDAINLSQDQIYSDIFSTSDNPLTRGNKTKLVENSSGNYLPVFGTVKNFRITNVGGSDVSFDVSIDLISSSAILESLKVNYISKLDLDSFTLISDSQKKSIAKDTGRSKLNGILSVVKEHIRNNFDQDNLGQNFLKYGLTDIENFGTIRFLGGHIATNDTNNETFKSYIKFDDFISILNNKVLLATDKKQPYVKISLQDERGEDLTIFGHYLQIPTDLNVCYIESCKNIDLLRYRLNLTDKSEQNDDTKFFVDEKYNKGLLKNIYLNIDFLIQAITDSKKYENTTLASYLEYILAHVNESLGYLNNFKLVTEATSNAIRIIDSSYTEDKVTKDKLLTLELSGLKTIVKSYQMASAITPDIANMVTIASGVNSGGETGVNTSVFDIFNKGLSDRIVKQKIEPESNANNSSDKIIEKATQNARYIEETLGSYVTKLNNSDGYIVVDGNVAQALKEFINLEVQLQQQLNGNDLHSSVGILPIKLSVVMDGISGFKIGDTFKVPSNMLPISYRGFGKTTKIGFVITRMGHTISENKWITNLETQTIILDSAGKYTPVTKCKIYEYSPFLLQNYGQQQRNVDTYAEFLKNN
jgi:hypothetical protein